MDSGACAGEINTYDEWLLIKKHVLINDYKKYKHT